MNSITDEIRDALFAVQDEDYRAFHAKLVPGIDENRIIGVRTPELRKLAKRFAKDERVWEFLAQLPHEYYEERNLHGFIISELKGYDDTLREIDRFLPVVDNWATCDLLSPKAFKQKKNRERLLVDIRRWMESKEPYTIRFGIEMLMSHYLDDDFRPEYLEWVADVTNEHYYVRMMVAWYFATALAKQFDEAVAYIEKRRLPEWTHRKAIQKAIESFRVTPANKEYLRLYR